MRILPGLLVTVISLLLFLPARNTPYYYDDYSHFLNNQKILAPHAATDIFHQGFQETRPVYNFSLAVQSYLFGTNSKAAHIVNLLFHLGVGFLLYLWLLIFFESIPLATLTAFLFLIHPIAVESVSYFNSRSGLLACLFSIAALYALHFSKCSVFSFFLGLVLLLLAIGSKEDGVFGVTTFFLILLYFNEKNSFSKNQRLCVASTLLLLPILYLTLKSPHVQSVGLAVSPWPKYFWQQGLMIPLHLSEYFWPFPLTLDRDLPLWMTRPLVILGGWVLLLILIGLVFRFHKKVALFGLAWALVALLPTHSFIPLLDQQSTRLLYCMLPGLSFFTASSLLSVYKRTKALGILFMLIFSIFFMFRTTQQVHLWLDPVALWTNNTDAAPSRWRSWLNLAVELGERKEWKKAQNSIAQAEKLAPHHPEVLYNAAVISMTRDDGQKNLPQAKKYLQEVLIQNPNHKNAKFLLSKLP